MGQESPIKNKGERQLEMQLAMALMATAAAANEPIPGLATNPRPGGNQSPAWEPIPGQGTVPPPAAMERLSVILGSINTSKSPRNMPVSALDSDCCSSVLSISFSFWLNPNNVVVRVFTMKISVLVIRVQLPVRQCQAFK